LIFPELQLGVGGIQYLFFDKVKHLNLNFRMYIDAGNNAIFEFFKIGENGKPLKTVSIENTNSRFTNLKMLRFFGVQNDPNDIDKAYLLGVGITQNNEAWFTYGDWNFGSKNASEGGIVFIKDDQG
jgi:hypothetical protein